MKRATIKFLTVDDDPNDITDCAIDSVKDNYSGTIVEQVTIEDCEVKPREN